MKTAAQIMKSKQFIKHELDSRVPKAESDALWEKAGRRPDGMMKQYAAIPKGKHTHTDNYIFPSAAIYLTLKEALDEKTAYAVIEEAAIKTFGIAHHILCGVPEWLYVRLGRTEEARQVITELFQKTSVTMFVCYAGFLIFGVALFAAVVSGLTPLPRWAYVFNTTLLMLVLPPTRIGGGGNWAGAIMFLGLLFLV